MPRRKVIGATKANTVLDIMMVAIGIMGTGNGLQGAQEIIQSGGEMHTNDGDVQGAIKHTKKGISAPPDMERVWQIWQGEADRPPQSQRKRDWKSFLPPNQKNRRDPPPERKNGEAERPPWARYSYYAT